MTTKKNKKQSREDNENIAVAIIGIIAIAFFLIFPSLLVALIIFCLVGVESERWSRWALLGQYARKRTDPDR